MSAQKQFGDREMVEDALSSQKFVTVRYNACANECASPAVMGELVNILNEEHQLQHELFDIMAKRGWYPSEPASQQRVDQVKSRFAPGTK